MFTHFTMIGYYPNDTSSSRHPALESYDDLRAIPVKTIGSSGVCKAGGGHNGMGRHLCCRTVSGRQPQPATGRQPAVSAGQRGVAAARARTAHTAGSAQCPAMAATVVAWLFRDLFLQPVLLLWAALHQCFKGLPDRGAEPGRDRPGGLVAVQGALEPGESHRHCDLHGGRQPGDRQS
ncbi:hypothetical protein D3C76_1124560 [compost metagenome]